MWGSPNAAFLQNTPPVALRKPGYGGRNTPRGRPPLAGENVAPADKENILVALVGGMFSCKGWTNVDDKLLLIMGYSQIAIQLAWGGGMNIENIVCARFWVLAYVKRGMHDSKMTVHIIKNQVSVGISKTAVNRVPCPVISQRVFEL